MSMETEGTATPEELAAFDEGFSETKTEQVEKPAPESAPVPDATLEAKEEPEPEVVPDAAPALTREELAAMRAAMADVSDMKGRLRDAYGRIGALNDLLHKKTDEKKTEGKPAVLTTVEMKRIREAYPELADDLVADLSEALANVKSTAQDADEMSRLVDERVAKAAHELRKETLAERHPDWEDVKKSEVFWKWIESLPQDEQKSIQTSASPMFIAGKLDTFKAWRDKSTKAKQKSQERLESAITPTSSAGTGKSNLSDEEAMQKAFAEGFNS